MQGVLLGPFCAIVTPFCRLPYCEKKKYTIAVSMLIITAVQPVKGQCPSAQNGVSQHWALSHIHRPFLRSTGTVPRRAALIFPPMRNPTLRSLTVHHYQIPCSPGSTKECYYFSMSRGLRPNNRYNIMF